VHTCLILLRALIFPLPTLYPARDEPDTVELVLVLGGEGLEAWNGANSVVRLPHRGCPDFG